MRKLFFAVLLAVSFSALSIAAKPKLIDFASNVYSQFGEDGIVQKIFEIIGTRSKVCVEFGASNGLFLSNTANLFVHAQWKAVLIERREDLYRQMVANVTQYNCIPINRTVLPEGPDSIDGILDECGVADPIDLMSIDIDGNDYYIFKTLKRKPRVVIVEHNPTMPASIDLYPVFGDQCLGCSVGALIRVAREKGYHLVAITDTNSFFVVDEEFEKFKEYETGLPNIRVAVDKYLRYIITNYRGEYKIIGTKNFDPSYNVRGPLPTQTYGEFTTINKRVS